MKCHLCDNKMVVATDPENCTYKCVSGCRRKEESWTEDADTLTKPDVREKRKLEDDPFYRLEHFAAGDGSGKTADEVRGKEAKATLYQLKAMQDVRSSEDGSLNRALRKSFQKKKKDDIAEEKDAAAERERFNMHIPLLPASEDDAAAARSQAFGARAVLSEDARYEALRRKTMRAVMNAPILQQQRAPSTPGSGISSPASSSGASRTSSSGAFCDPVPGSGGAVCVSVCFRVPLAVAVAVHVCLILCVSIRLRVLAVSMCGLLCVCVCLTLCLAVPSCLHRSLSVAVAMCLRVSLCACVCARASISLYHWPPP